MFPEMEEKLSSNSQTSSDIAQMQVDAYNGRVGNLDYYDCQICKNKGTIAFVNSKGDYAIKQCSCIVQRRIIQRTRQSGMGLLLEKRFDNFEKESEHQEAFYKVAKSFLNQIKSGNKPWMMLCGQSGSGKTHICAATCNVLLKSGFEVYYMPWVDESKQLKRLAMDEVQYRERMEQLQTVPVLYIDDLFKSGKTDADKSIAFELLNSRINRDNITVISTELLLTDLLEIDEAIFSRLIEKCGTHISKVSKDMSKNYRLRGVI